eukprot:scaffold198_cov28-Prasinocladus_malaysianus.AAC.2
MLDIDHAFIALAPGATTYLTKVDAMYSRLQTPMSIIIIGYRSLSMFWPSSGSVTVRYGPVTSDIHSRWQSRINEICGKIAVFTTNCITDA